MRTPPKRKLLGKVNGDARMRSVLVKELDRIFARYIVARDGGRCVLCGSAEQPECGHLFTRAAMATRWSEMNAHCQCHLCNAKHEEDAKPYTDWFISKYGEAGYEQLLRLHNTVVHFTNNNLRKLIEGTKIVLADRFR